MLLVDLRQADPIDGFAPRAAARITETDMSRDLNPAGAGITLSGFAYSKSTNHKKIRFFQSFFFVVRGAEVTCVRCPSSGLSH